MKIIYRKGDLLQQVNIQVIGHQCNCFNSFGKGLARQIKEQYPESYHVDCSTIKGDMNKLGTFSITKNTTPLVANIYSQYYYGTNQIQTNYGALELSLDKLGNYMINKNLLSLGLPYMIGCGLAGGNWDTVLNIITKFSEKFVTIQIYIVKL